MGQSCQVPELQAPRVPLPHLFKSTIEYAETIAYPAVFNILP